MTSPLRGQMAGLVRTQLVPPQRARRLLVEWSPLGIKVGQYLALLPDVFAPEYCAAFAELQDRAPPEPFESVLGAIRDDFGAQPLTLFQWIESTPIGAGSLAQVHRARTRNGADVAVKVKRAGVDRRAREQLGRAGQLARLLESFGLAAGISLTDLVAEVRRWIEAELDFERELKNLGRFYERFRGDPRIRVPQPFAELSGRRVITLEFLPGAPLTGILASLPGHGVLASPPPPVDPAELAEDLLAAIFRQIFEVREFHADLHPGNILVLPDRALGFVDYGHVERLDPTVEAGLHRYFRGLRDDDAQAMVSGLLDVLHPGNLADPDGFKRDFLDENSRWLRERSGTTGQISPTSRYLAGILRAARRHRFVVPPSALAVYRAVMAAEATAVRLAGRQVLGTVAGAFFERLERRKLAELMDREVVQAGALQLLDLLREAPSHLTRLLTDVAEDRFVLRVERTESSESRRRADTRAKMVTLAILAIALAILASAWGGTSLVGVSRLNHLLLPLLMIAFLWIAILWRRLD